MTNRNTSIRTLRGLGNLLPTVAQYRELLLTACRRTGKTAEQIRTEAGSFSCEQWAHYLLSI